MRNPRQMKRMFQVRGLYSSVWVCLLACLLVAGVAYLIIGNVQMLGQARSQARRTRMIETTTERLQGALRDAESTQRGYLLTHRADYLESEAAAARASELIAALQTLTEGTPEHEVTSKIAELARQKLAELAETVDLSRRGQQEQALAIVNSNRGKELMDQIRVLADRMSEATGRQNAHFVESVDAIQRQLTVDVTAISALSILLMISLTYVSRRDGLRIRNAAEELAITLRSIGDAVVTTDAQGYVTFLNPIATALGQRSLP